MLDRSAHRVTFSFEPSGVSGLNRYTEWVLTTLRVLWSFTTLRGCEGIQLRLEHAEWTRAGKPVRDERVDDCISLIDVVALVFH
jgi:hypothetical protein